MNSLWMYIENEQKGVNVVEGVWEAGVAFQNRDDGSWAITVAVEKKVGFI